MSNTDTTKTVNLIYITPDAPRVAAPEYPGKYYDAQVPATLDLAERARLCVNALTECTDPIPERTDRGGETLWTNVRRFVPAQEIPWC